MSIFWPVTFILVLLLQAGGIPPSAEEIFDRIEKAKLEKEQDVEGRIKVYENASKRIQKTLETAVGNDDFQTVPDKLKLWISLLSKSLEDIEANLKNKKKSRALIRYEIQVRKSIANTENYKIRAPVEQQDLFDASLAEAEKIRQKFVAILFPH